MTKLTVAHLFDTVQSLQNLDGFQLPHSTASAGARETIDLTRMADEPRSAPPIGSMELSMALRAAFGQKGDRVLSPVSAWQISAGRPSRIDQGHIGQRGAAPRDAFPSISTDCQEIATGGLATALGLAQARDCLGQDSWVVVVLGSTAISAALESGEFEAVAKLERVLVVWADDDLWQQGGAGDWLSDRMSAITGMAQIGPLAGLDAEGLVSVLRAVKTLGEAALVHLRVRKSAKPERARRKLKELRASAPGVSTSRGEGSIPAVNEHVADRRDAVHRIDPPHLLAPAMSATIGLLRQRVTRDRRIAVVDLLSDSALHTIGQATEGLLRPPSGAGVAWYEGLSAGGCRPVLLIDSPAASRCEPWLFHDVWQRRLPLTIVACGDLAEAVDARGLGGHRPGGHSVWHMVPPDMPVMAPGTTADLDAMLDLASAGTTSAMIVVSPHLSEAPDDVFARRSPLQLGRGQCLCQGGDVTLLAWGATVSVARRAAFELARMGIEATVVNPLFLRPLDEELIARVAKRAQGTVIIEDPSLPSEMMLDVLRVFSEGGQTLPFVRITLDGHDWADGDESCVAHLVDRCRSEFVIHQAAHSLPSLPRTPPARPIRPLPPADAERSAALNCELSADVMRWVDAYVGIGKRDLYLWRWARRGADLTTLPCVAPERVAHGCDTKVLSIMLCVLLDDIADLHGRGEFLDLLVSIVCDLRAEDLSSLSCDEQRYAQTAYDLAREYEQRIQTYPHYHEYQELLRYDAAQFANTLRYSHLLNRNAAYLNLVEHDLYLPHNMHMMSFATLDLMCTEDFPRQEVGKLREAAWHGQCMGRIGNLLSTWRRELVQKDLTSGIFARAVTSGELTLEQIAGDDTEKIEALLGEGRHEYYFIRRWQHHRDCMEAALGRVRGIELASVLEGHDRFFQMHLGSQGFI